MQEYEVSGHSANDIAKKKHRRRSSTASGGSTLGAYMEQKTEASRRGNAVLGIVTMLHIGVVITVIGFLFIIAALVTYEQVAALIGTGIICIVIGIFLIILDLFNGKKKKEALHTNGNSKSGHQILENGESDRDPV